MPDYFFNEKLVLPWKTVHLWTAEFFEACGMSPEDAACCADVFISADLRGVYSHGIIRLPSYCKRLQMGGANPRGVPKVIKRSGSVALVDGDNAMGQVVARYSMNQAIEIAKELGSSTVSVTMSNHLGTSAYYALMAAEQNMLGMVWAMGGANNIAPWGGVDPRLGNNPFAFAAPCLTKPPVVLDMAQSVVAGGKIMMAIKTNSSIPSTWALDKYGKPTTDPAAANEGTLRPIGDYKGYGISFMNTVFSAILSDSSFGPDVVDIIREPEKAQNTGHLFKVIDISAITDLASFKKRMDAMVDYMKSAQKSEGTEEIFVPGELEELNRQRQLQKGITYPVELIEELRKYSKSLGITPRV